jgi:hypothetical protein
MLGLNFGFKNPMWMLGLNFEFINPMWILGLNFGFINPMWMLGLNFGFINPMWMLGFNFGFINPMWMLGLNFGFRIEFWVQKSYVNTRIEFWVQKSYDICAVKWDSFPETCICRGYCPESEAQLLIELTLLCNRDCKPEAGEIGASDAKSHRQVSWRVDCCEIRYGQRLCWHPVGQNKCCVICGDL